MRSKILKLMLILTISVICFFIISAIQGDETHENEAVTAAETYTIKEYDGKVAVFKNQDSAPHIIYDAYISVLPDSDQERLKKGITVDNTADLQKIIEDYTS